MIHYYYEIADNVRVYGHTHKYLAQYNDVTNTFSHWKYFHDEAVKNSTRVWMEDDAGVTLVKGPSDDDGWDRVTEDVLVWLKLICKDVGTL